MFPQNMLKCLTLGVLNALHFYVSFPAMKTKRIVAAKILIFCCMVLTCDMPGQGYIRCTSKNGQCPAKNWYHFNIARNYPHIFLFPVCMQEKSTGVKKHKYNVLIQCELFYCDYVCGF